MASILNWTQKSISNQCSFCRTWDTSWYLQVPVSTWAAAFYTSCNFCVIFRATPHRVKLGFRQDMNNHARSFISRKLGEHAPSLCCYLVIQKQIRSTPKLQTEGFGVSATTANLGVTLPGTIQELSVPDWNSYHCWNHSRKICFGEVNHNLDTWQNTKRDLGLNRITQTHTHTTQLLALAV